MRKNAVAFAVATTLAAPAGWAAGYTITTIDFPGASGTLVEGLNDAGTVVGAYGLPTGKGAGFTESGGTFTSVGESLPCRPNGKCGTAVTAVNDLGLMAGAFSPDVDFPGAFIQSICSSEPLIVEPPEYPNTAVILAGLNNWGVLAGWYSNDVSAGQIFELIGGSFKTISLPVADVVFAAVAGLNDLGQLTGGYETSTASHGFILSGTHLTTLDLPAEWGGMFIDPTKINDLGVVIGNYEITSQSFPTVHAFAVAGGVFRKIDFPGAASTDVYGFNDQGEILGHYSLSPTGGAADMHTFLLKDGEYSDLSSLFPGNFSVEGLNNRGQLFGWYTDTNCTPTCVTHGFVATPTEE